MDLYKGDLYRTSYDNKYYFYAELINLNPLMMRHYLCKQNLNDAVYIRESFLNQYYTFYTDIFRELSKK
jgi:hypothetical protein